MHRTTNTKFEFFFSCWQPNVTNRKINSPTNYSSDIKENTRHSTEITCSLDQGRREGRLNGRVGGGGGRLQAKHKSSLFTAPLPGRSTMTCSDGCAMLGFIRFSVYFGQGGFLTPSNALRRYAPGLNVSLAM